MERNAQRMIEQAFPPAGSVGEAISDALVEVRQATETERLRVHCALVGKDPQVVLARATAEGITPMEALKRMVAEG